MHSFLIDQRMFDAMLECMYRTPDKKKIVQKDQSGNLVTTLTYASEIGHEEEAAQVEQTQDQQPQQQQQATPEKVFTILLIAYTISKRKPKVAFGTG